MDAQTAGSWQSLKQHFHSLLDAATADRSALLAGVRAEDPDLAGELAALLEHHQAPDTLFSRGALAELAAGAVGSEAGPAAVPENIGPYRILREIGRGGMGTVYLAARISDFEQRVAIKRVQAGRWEAALERRFLEERQILARLDHPNIARLLDGGRSRDGSPYLVMEYVEGLPIDRYCEQRRLPIAERLELLRAVCGAVQYAHQNLIIHRDLKPSNILVTSEGIPKLLDFGIAKLLDPGEGAADLTPESSRPMTPRYASPEQVLGETITTATDIWALGLLLYDLLTLRLPFGLSGCPTREVRRRILEAEAEAPSRLTHLPPLRRQVTGDVDAIVLEALRKAPEGRYPSAEQLAADVRRYLDGLPVAARRGRWLYRAGKTVKRRPGAVLAVALVAASSVGSTVLWRQAEAERRQVEVERQRTVVERAAAVREQERAERVSDFLKDLFQAADPDAQQGGQLPVREALDAGRRRLAEGLEGEPELEAELAGTLGDVYRDLGLWQDANQLMQRAVELRRKLYPEGDPRLAVALNDLASVYYYRERYADAEVLLRESLALRRRLGAEPAQVARALNNLASVLKPQGRLTEAGQLYEEALAIRESALGATDPAVALSLYSLGALRFEEGDLEAAEPLLRRALAVYQAAHGERHTRVASVLSTLGRVLHARGAPAAARPLLERALATRRELLGEEHPHVVSAREALAAVVEDGEAGSRD